VRSKESVEISVPEIHRILNRERSKRKSSCATAESMAARGWLLSVTTESDKKIT